MIPCVITVRYSKLSIVTCDWCTLNMLLISLQSLLMCVFSPGIKKKVDDVKGISNWCTNIGNELLKVVKLLSGPPQLRYLARWVNNQQKIKIIT